MTQDAKSCGDIKQRQVPTIWAQRNDKLIVTFQIEGCKNPTVSVESNKIKFFGTNIKGIVFEADMELFSEVQTKEYNIKKGYAVECNITKKTTGFWPRLLKDKSKVHWLKVDFNRWKDEDDTSDEEDIAGNEPELSQMMAQMGGGMPDMGDLNEDVDDVEIDSDDEDIPDLEQNEAAKENGETA